MKHPLLSGLRRLETNSIRSLTQQLREQGFACLIIDDERLQEGVRTGILEAQKLNSFRFPPIDAQIIEYSQPKREAFQALFSIATIAFGSLVASNPFHGASRRFQVALDHTKHTCLFSENPHEPFEPGKPFSQTFFNLFNYNHGLLNPHVDRSLMTVVYSMVPDCFPPRIEATIRSALWIQDKDGNWANGDDATSRDDQVLIMVGEDFEESGLAKHLDIYAAKHAVKIDPNGPNIARAHFRPDPSTILAGNRLSAALILRHDPHD